MHYYTFIFPPGVTLKSQGNVPFYPGNYHSLCLKMTQNALVLGGNSTVW